MGCGPEGQALERRVVGCCPEGRPSSEEQHRAAALKDRPWTEEQWAGSLSFYDVAADGIDPYALAGNPVDPPLDVLLGPVQLQDHPSPVPGDVGAADIGYHIELLSQAVNDGLCYQFWWEREFDPKLGHLYPLLCTGFRHLSALPA